MMEKKRLQINWKVVLIVTFIALIFLGFLYLYQQYNAIVASKVTNKDKVESMFLEETNLENIEHISDFYEENAYYIAIGTNDEDEAVIIYTPMDDSGQYDEFILADLLEPNEIMQQWENDCSACRINKTNYAMIDEEPLYEIAYYNEDNKYRITYVHLEDGEYYHTLKFN